MYIIFLKFSENKKSAPEFMEAHVAWVNAGIEEGIFCLAGGLFEFEGQEETKNALGGAILATHISYNDLVARIHQDPFVVEDIVTAEIMYFDLGFASEAYKFALNSASAKG